jgi:hypothetical protein
VEPGSTVNCLPPVLIIAIDIFFPHPLRQRYAPLKSRLL